MRLLQVVPATLSFIVSQAEALLRDNRSALARRLRQRMLSTPTKIDTGVIITNPANFLGERGSALYHGTYVLNDRGTLRLGADSHLGAHCYVNVQEGRVAIGRGVAIGPGTRLFAYSNHYENGRRVVDTKLVSDVVIGDNVLIGANCCLLPGTQLGENCVVGAGTVVKGVVKPGSVISGPRFRLIKMLEPDAR